LGFKDEENCIIIKSSRDALRKVLYYKEDLDLLKKISLNGYNLVHQNYDIDKTIKKFSDSIIKEL
jgi:spore maturation protein CgeB